MSRVGLVGGRARALLRLVFDAEGGVTRDELTATLERGRGWSRGDVNGALRELRDAGMIGEPEPGRFVSTLKPGARP